MTEYFIATNGDDIHNNGTIEHPYATMGPAYGRVGVGDIISFRGGTYYTQTYGGSFLPDKSGITIRAYPGEEVVILGGIQKEWTYDGDRGWWYTHLDLNAYSHYGEADCNQAPRYVTVAIDGQYGAHNVQGGNIGSAYRAELADIFVTPPSCLLDGDGQLDWNLCFFDLDNPACAQAMGFNQVGATMYFKSSQTHPVNPNEKAWITTSYGAGLYALNDDVCLEGFTLKYAGLKFSEKQSGSPIHGCIARNNRIYCTAQQGIQAWGVTGLLLENNYVDLIGGWLLDQGKPAGAGHLSSGTGTIAGEISCVSLNGDAGHHYDTAYYNHGNVFWEGGQRLGVTITATTSTTFAFSGGDGDDLPAQDTAVSFYMKDCHTGVVQATLLNGDLTPGLDPYLVRAIAPYCFGHGLRAGDQVNVYWKDGNGNYRQRLNVDVTVSGTTVTLSGGTGDSLEDGTVCVARVTPDNRLTRCIFTHGLYMDTCDNAIVRDNFFGRSASGYSIQPCENQNVVWYNNICYADSGVCSAFAWEGDNHQIFNNIFIQSPPRWLAAGYPGTDGNGSGMKQLPAPRAGAVWQYTTPQEANFHHNFLEADRCFGSLAYAPPYAGGVVHHNLFNARNTSWAQFLDITCSEPQPEILFSNNLWLAGADAAWRINGTSYSTYAAYYAVVSAYTNSPWETDSQRLLSTAVIDTAAVDAWLSQFTASLGEVQDYFRRYAQNVLQATGSSDIGPTLNVVDLWTTPSIADTATLYLPMREGEYGAVYLGHQPITIQKTADGVIWDVDGSHITVTDTQQVTVGTAGCQLTYTANGGGSATGGGSPIGQAVPTLNVAQQGATTSIRMVGSGTVGGRKIRGYTSADRDFTVTAEPRSTLISSTSTPSDATIDDVAYRSYASATVDQGADIVITPVGGLPLGVCPSITALPTSVVSVDEAGRITRVSDGEAALNVTYGQLTKRISVSVSRATGVAMSEFVAYVAGSLAKSCSDAVDSRTAGLTLDNRHAAWGQFGLYFPAEGPYVRNAECWLSDVASALTCVSVAQSQSAAGPWTTTPTATLLSPRHVVMAKPQRDPTGTIMRFVTGDGNDTVVERTITAAQDLSGQELTVGLLDSNVPTTIAFAAVLPSDWTSYLPSYDPTVSFAPLSRHQLANVPVVALNRHKQALVYNLYEIGPVVRCVRPTGMQRQLLYADLAVEDAGTPVFLLVDNALVLLTTWSGYQTGPVYSDLASGMTSVMQQLGGNDEVTTVELSSFNSY